MNGTVFKATTMPPNSGGFVLITLGGLGMIEKKKLKKLIKKCMKQYDELFKKLAKE